MHGLHAMIEEQRKWLEYYGFSKALEEIVAELYVVRLLIETELNPNGCIVNDGVCNLLDTIAYKIGDMAAGRTPDLMLPKLPEQEK